MTVQAIERPPKLASNFGEAIDIRQLLSVARRRLPVAVIVGVLVFIATALLVFSQKESFTATANVLLDSRQRDVVRVQSVLPNLPPDTNIVDTEVEVLRSRALAEAVMVILKLDQDPEFNPALSPPGGIKGLIAKLQGKPPTPLKGKVAAAPGPQARQAIVDRVLGGLKVGRSGLTYMINISYRSPDPIKAAKIANMFADLYIADQLSAKSKATVEASEWLGGRLAQLKGDVERAEAQVEQYKIANNLLSSQGATLTEQQINTLDQQLASSRAEAAEREARLSTAQSQLARGSTGDDVGEALGSQVVQQLRGQRAEVSRRVAELEARYSDKHPQLIEKRKELNEIDNQIRQEIARVISNLDAQAQVARQRVASIQGSVSSAKGALEGNNRAGVRLRELERNAEAVRAVYETFLGRFRETSAQSGLAQSDARVVSWAKPPTNPTSPDIKLGLLLAFLLAGASGVAAISLAEAMESGLSTSADVEKLLGVRSIGSVPLLSSTVARKDRRLSPENFVLQRPLSSFAESFRAVQALIMTTQDGLPVKMIAVTSSLPGEGKTTTSVCLARQLALAGYRTLLIDCDLRHRSLSKLLRLSDGPGLVEVLDGRVSMVDALHRDEASGLDVLPISVTRDVPNNVFMSDASNSLLSLARGRYDVVVLDTPPVLPVADTTALAPKADAVLYLTRWRRTPAKAVEAGLRLLAHVKAPVAGVVLTQVDVRAQARDGYGDSGYYYNSYRKYYLQ